MVSCFMIVLKISGLLSQELGKESKIAAVVNQELITQKELNDRLKLVLLSTGIKDNSETRKKMIPQILHSMIEERLQLAEIKRTHIEVPPEEIKMAWNSIEKQNNMPSGSLRHYLEENDISIKTLEDQIFVQIGWGIYIRSAFPQHRQIEERAIDQVVEEMNLSQGKPQYLLSEIFLAVTSPDKEEDVQRSAFSIFEQLRAGAPFPFLAQQFSKSASAATGGDIGWVREDQLDPALKKVLEGAQPIIVTTPIRTQEGYYILALRDKRILSRPEAHEAVLTFKNVRVELGNHPSSKDLENSKKGFERLRKKARSCQTLDLLAKSLLKGKVKEFEDLTEEDIPPHIYSLLKDLDVNAMSETFVDQGGMNALMMCKKRLRGSEESQRDLALRQLQQEKLSSLASKLLRDMKQNAYIDIRI